MSGACTPSGELPNADDADAHARRQLVDERVGGALGGGQPGRRDVRRRHRARVVDDEHHRRLSDRLRCSSRAGAPARTRAPRSPRARTPRAECAATRSRPVDGELQPSRPPGSGPRSASPGGGRGSSPQDRQRHQRQRQAARVATRSSSQAAPELEQPVLVGRQRDVVDPQPAQLAGDRLAALALELGEPLAHAAAATCRPRPVRRSRDRPAQRCPTAGSSASRGSAISIASTEWRTRSEPSGRSQPRWSRKSEITTTSPAAGQPARRAQRARQPSGSCWPSGATPSASIRRSATIPGLEPRGGSTRGAPAPNATSPTLPARRTPSRPNTSATPSATSAFRRCAVPNAIDGETSSTIHVVSARSGTCRRTCGWPVRAVAAGSMWRTSSPISYGRSCASSVPSADPGRAPVARQASARSAG